MRYRPTGNPRGRPRYPGALTPAEQRVLEYIRDGLSNAEIAVRLGIGPETVKSHVASMLSKLALPDRHALAAWEPVAEPQPAGRRWALGIPALLARIGGAPAAAIVGGVALAGLGVAGTALLVAAIRTQSGDDPAATASPTAVVVVPATARPPTGTPAPPLTATSTGTPIPTTTPTPGAPGVVPVHPPGTRTGIDVVDRVIAAVEAGDAAALYGMLVYQKWPCGGDLDLPCEAGEASGTTVAFFPVVRCQFEPVRQRDASIDLVGEILDPAPGLYAITRREPTSEDIVPVIYSVVVARGGVGTAIGLSDEGITTINSGCGLLPAALLDNGLFDGKLLLGPSAPTQLWQRKYGQAETDDWAGAIRALGRDYIVAITSSGTPFPAADAPGGVDIYVGHFQGRSDSLYWSRQLGGAGREEVLDTTTHNTATFIAGASGSRTFDGLTSAGGQDVLVARIGALGANGWTRLFGGPLDDRGDAIAVARDGSVYVAGTTAVTTEAENGPEDTTQALLLKYSPKGELLWSREYGDIAYDQFLDVVGLEDGSVIAVGEANRPGFSVGVGDQGADALVTRWSADGELLWERLLDIEWNERAAGVTVLSDGTLLVAGDTASFNDEGLPLKADVALWAFDVDGNDLWDRRIGDAADEWSVAAEALADGRFVVASWVDAYRDSGAQRVGPVLSRLLWFEADGTVLWSRDIDGPGLDRVTGLDSDETGAVYATGWDTESRPDGKSPEQEPRDVWVVKYR